MRRLLALVLLASVASACGDPGLPSNVDSAACGSAAHLLRVVQGAMDPTLRPDDVLAIVPLRRSVPNRGDIVAIDWPTWTGDDGHETAMRVIGTPGDDIALRAGSVILNGSALSEPYLEAGVATNAMPDGPSAWVVPDGSSFVLGDGREWAADSRTYGLVPDRALQGRVVFRCGPAGRSGPVS